MCTCGLWTATAGFSSGYRQSLPRLIDRGATESILVSARRPFFAFRRRKFVCRCLNTPAVRRVDGDPSRDTFGEVDELVSHTSIRCFAIFGAGETGNESVLSLECILLVIFFLSVDRPH